MSARAAWSAVAESARAAGIDARTLERVRRYLVRCVEGTRVSVAEGEARVAPLAGVAVVFRRDERPPAPLAIECPHYDPLPRSARCAWFAAGGGCRRAGARACPEWLRGALDEDGSR